MHEARYHGPLPCPTGRARGFLLPRLSIVQVPIPSWKGSLRIVHLTDLHFGVVTPRALNEHAVALTNAAAPDLVLLTGDFVARGKAFLPVLTRVLSRIEAPCLAVLGNHDHFVGADRVQSALEEAGVRVLTNSWTLAGAREGAIAIVGIDDYGTCHHDIEAATRGLGGRPALGLSHNPEAAPLLWEKGVHIVLSGHTHGGQLHAGGLTRRFYEGVLHKRYVEGWYHVGDDQVFVNPGLGSTLFPWRSGSAQRTVALLELGAGPE